jgi:serine/threonine protein kinase
MSAPIKVDVAVERNWSIEHEELSFGPEVARGEFGSVFDGKFFGARVAIKLIRGVKDGSPILKYVERELDIQSMVAHPNVVQFIGLSRSPANEVFVVTEWAGRGDLQRYLYGEATSASNQVSWQQKVQFMVHIAQATAYLHSKRIVHRDIKCANCLLTQGLIVKLCDFGLSRVLPKEAEVLPTPMPTGTKKGSQRRLGDTPLASRLSMAGTDEWMAPEVALGQQYGRRVDVFSFGVSVWEIAVRAKPRARLPQEFFEFPEAEFRKSLASDAPAGLAELTIECCALEPHARPKSRQVMIRLQSLFDATFVAKSPSSLLSPLSSPRTTQRPGPGARRQLPLVSAVVSTSPL